MGMADIITEGAFEIIVGLMVGSGVGLFVGNTTGAGVGSAVGFTGGVVGLFDGSDVDG